ncbi:MAG: solute:sodium symporter family transporter [Lentisphaeria bacterium]|nr:solute:sodium symporter family transporter [Lentisphaeria bacterium]
MSHLFTLLSFVFFTGMVAVVTYFITRKEDVASNDGYFLAGRNLTFPIIAGSLLLTNLSTEQLVGLNGDAFTFGLSVMVWEVLAVVALVAMGLFFLPRFLKSGIATLPQFLDLRFGASTQLLCNLIFLLAYALILLPIILYTGASGLAGILNLSELTGIENRSVLLWLTVWFVGIIGSIYALFGGLRSVAVSDTLNGIGLLTGGLLITYLGLSLIGDGNALNGLNTLGEAIPDRFNSIGGPKTNVPFYTIFTGVLLNNLFYWCTNQQIIQRTLAARSLSEGQKGIFLTGALKLLGPLYLVLPGIMAFYLYGAGNGLRPVDAYGTLVRNVLPAPLAGFFAAVMVGAILSSFNSALNSTCTLFSLGIYKAMWKKDAGDVAVVQSGKRFGYVVAILAMCVAPFLDGQESIFNYLQKMNGIYFIPIFAVVVVGMLAKRVPAIAANAALVIGVVTLSVGFFAFPQAVAKINDFHFLGIVFALLVAMMLAIGAAKPTPTAWTQQDTSAVELKPWKYATPTGIALLVLVFLIYAIFADFTVLAG